MDAASSSSGGSRRGVWDMLADWVMRGWRGWPGGDEREATRDSGPDLDDLDLPALPEAPQHDAQAHDTAALKAELRHKLTANERSLAYLRSQVRVRGRGR